MNLRNDNPVSPPTSWAPARRLVAPVLVAPALTALLLTACGRPEPAAQAPGAAAPAAAGAPQAPQAPQAERDAAVTRAQLENGPLEPACTLENVVDMSNERPFPGAQAVYTLPRDKVVKMIGFATVKSKGEALGAFTAYLAGTAGVYKLNGVTRLDRPDVVAYFNNASGMLKSGYHLDANLSGMPAGDYAVYLQRSGSPACPTHHTLRIQ